MLTTTTINLMTVEAFNGVAGVCEVFADIAFPPPPKNDVPAIKNITYSNYQSYHHKND